MSRARRERPPSLAAHAAVWLLLPLVALVPPVAGLIYWLALGPALDGLDRALTDTAVALAQIVEVRDGRVTLPLSAQTERAARRPGRRDLLRVGDERSHLLAGQARCSRSRRRCPRAVALLRGQPGWQAGARRGACDGLRRRLRRGPARSWRPRRWQTRAAAERAALLAALAGAAALALPMVVLMRCWRWTAACARCAALPPMSRA